MARIGLGFVDTKEQTINKNGNYEKNKTRINAGFIFYFKLNSFLILST